MLNKNKFGLIFGFLLIIIISSNVNALPSCCLKTNDNQFCIDDALNCASGQSISGSCDDLQITQCNKGTCVPSNGVCLSDYRKEQCTSQGGIFFSEPKEQVSECKIGCCKETSTCGVVQKTQCSGEFDASITDSATCDSSCAPNELGCCVSSTNCEFGKRIECTDGTFEAGKQCNQNQFCNAKFPTHKYTACGDNNLIANSELDVYWYDSNGNMEEKVGTKDSKGVVWKVDGKDMDGECKYPDEKCFDPDEKGGRENAYCKSTACIIEGQCPECKPETFLHGESICLDIFKGHFTNDQKSKYLKEYVLACDSGEIVEDRELTRSEEICVDTSQVIDGVTRKKADTIPNEWQSCLGCGGDSSSVLDYGGYIPIFGAVPMSAFGTWCGTGSISNSVPGGFGATTCDDIKGEREVTMCYYDNDFWAPLGSCNPVYTPSTSEKCGDCGKGGDGKTNVCTEQECNALGDCEFKENKGLDVDGLAQTGALAIGGATAVMAASQVACNAIAWIPGAQVVCFHTSLSGVGGVFGSSLFWGVYSLVIGTTVGSSQGYEDMYNDFSYNKGGYYDLAQFIAAGNAVSSSLGKDVGVNYNMWYRSTSAGIQGMNLLLDLENEISQTSVGNTATSFFAEKIGRKVLYNQAYEKAVKEFGGTFVTEEAYKKAAEEAGKKAGEAASKEATKEAAIGAGSVLAKVLNVAGVAYSVYSASEAWQTGSCNPETAHTNSDHCEQCGAGEGQFFCTEDRCKILGADNGHCKYLPGKDGVDGTCITNDPGDVALPNIERIKLEFYDINESFVLEKIVEDNVLTMDNAIDWNKADLVKINITTSSRSNCKAGFVAEANYSGMEYTFEDGFTETHTLNFSLTEEIKTNSESTLFIKCENTNGKTHGPKDDMNRIVMKFKARPDVIPPTFKSIDPYTAFSLPEGTNNITVTLKVYDNNGVAGCKFSEEKTNYAEMEGTFNKGSKIECPGSTVKDCDTFTNNFNLGDAGEEIDLTSYGYDENGTIYTYVLGCVDVISQDNFGTMNYSFIVYPSFGLNVSAPEDGEELYTTRPTIKIETEVNSQCLYKFDNEINWTKLNDLIDTKIYDYKIKRDITSSPEGTQHTLYVKCVDTGHNVVEKSVNFYAVSDVEPAYPVRIYTTGSYGSGQLHVLLNEQAVCKFMTDNSDYDYESEGTLMRAVPPENEEQVTTWDNTVYYIKCKDEFDNLGGFTIYP
ncbi:hypothetical protein J4438_01390 [Candidatus Woesearchaeota archaeon]|nr:hypothetical protein [Candidatus Woesearchaeota archaeon]